MSSFRPPGMVPLPPRRKWRAITIATLVLVPAFWSLMAGLVALATDEAKEPAGAPAAVAFGLALLPFVFVALRMDVDHTVKSRVWAVVLASAYTAVLVWTIGGLALLPAPIFPFTALGIADHMAERRADAAPADQAQA